MMDQDIGNLVLAADLHFKLASNRTILAARIFGRRQTFVHLGCRFTISTWRGLPYLLSVHDVAAPKPLTQEL